jgi:hypothetical protein
MKRPGSRRWTFGATVVPLGLLTLTAALPLSGLAQEGGTRDAGLGSLQAQVAPRPPVSTGSQPQIPAIDPLRTPVSLSHPCAPAEVITTRTLVVVQCRTAVQGARGLEEVHVFAVGVEDPSFASRVLKVAMSAQIAGYRAKITFTSSDVSGERLGCQRKSCRLIETISLLVN